MSATATMTTVVPQRRVMSLQATAPPRASSLKAEAQFGQYILGQTLGEGEFGKVKLGWARNREGTNGDAQVAIKLIRKESVGKSRSRITKIEREINVLKRVSHPNIVKCHEVVETEKYIGIILEYASGGELFDYILAHRYLRDPMASKLFAQLISAVQYLHLRGIVHRDLKLENLLLDRNRNIIITDFGFANTFDPLQSTDDAQAMKKREFISNGKILGDLMQTSCGSPCYAAPELVVSDGHYCGRKVDVWSCGVILYAMLAGYLPFDDDPSNPEGDNISLLYKYIVSTPLTFPEYVTPLARDLLRRILVPDPQHRAFLTDITSHTWLAPHSHIMSLAQDADHAKTKHTRAGSQDMMRSSSERSAAHGVTSLPTSSHLVPTGFAKNTSMGPPELLTTPANKRHTVQIEYEQPLLTTVRNREQDRTQIAAAIAEEETVAGLSIAAASSMARSASHTGSQHPIRNITPAQTHNPMAASRSSRLPAPDFKPRPTSYHPSLASDHLSGAVKEFTATPVKDKRQSWSRGSISNSKTASPRSTNQNVSGEISGTATTEPSLMIVRSNSVNAKTAPAPITRTRRQHKRNSSSISSVFGRLWSGASPTDTSPTEDEEAALESPAMHVINETEDAPSTATSDQSQKKLQPVSGHKHRSSIAFLTSRFSIVPQHQPSNSSLPKKSIDSSARPSKDCTREARLEYQSKNKSAGQTSKSSSSDKASTSAAKRVMDFFSGRRKYKAQEA